VERYLHTARQIGDLQILSPALVTAAVVAWMNRDDPTAAGYLHEFDDATRDGPTEYRELQLPEAVRICRTLADPRFAEVLAGARPVVVAAEASDAGDYGSGAMPRQIVSSRSSA